jgi:hypothetical protein
MDIFFSFTSSTFLWDHFVAEVLIFEPIPLGPATNKSPHPIPFSSVLTLAAACSWTLAYTPLRTIALRKLWLIFRVPTATGRSVSLMVREATSCGAFFERSKTITEAAKPPKIL